MVEHQMNVLVTCGGDATGTHVVTNEPVWRLPDFGGLEPRRFKSIAESRLKARKLRRRLVSFPLPFKFSLRLASGCLLAPGHRDGRTTLEHHRVEKSPA
jgi:hypothetical protein